MTTYLDWLRTRLTGAPDTACAFWVDVSHLLARRSGGGLDDADRQTIHDDMDRDWTVVAYRANPLPARQLIREHGRRTIVWCLGDPGADSVDLTAFEDYLGRAWSVADVGLDAIAQELRPELSLPTGLSAALKGVTFNAVEFVQALAEQARQVPLTLAAALNTLVELLNVGSRGIDVSAPSVALTSTALCYASATSSSGLRATQVAIEAAADIESRYGHLLRTLSQSEPRDVATAAYVGSGLAGLGLANVGSLLTGEGFCPPGLRAAFEEAGGKWSELANVMSPEEWAVLAHQVEQPRDAAGVARLRDVMADVGVDVGAAAAEPRPALRLAGLLAHIDEFISGPWLALASPVLVDSHDEELKALDAIGLAVRAGNAATGSQPPPVHRLDQLADAFAESPMGLACLDAASGRRALPRIEKLLSSDMASHVRVLLKDAERSIDESMTAWDAAWVAVIKMDVNGYQTHERQGWQRVKSFADSGANRKSWLLILDGLRYDLWKRVVAPALEQAGWQLPSSDVSFAYLPSSTDISRRALIGGAPGAGQQSESRLVESTAERLNTQSTYLLRTEHVTSEHEEARGWNVRVFSWPDRLVHLDLADLGTLVSQFGLWIEQEFIPWMRANVSPDQRAAISTDHGFATLSPDDAIEVTLAGDMDRNTPRVLQGSEPSLGESGLVLEDAAQSVTIATTRRWFRCPGGHHWKFAHGGCTLHETVVPFAELVSLPEAVAQIIISGLAQELVIHEDGEATLDFRVKVVGGSEMFPSVTVHTNQEQLLRTQFAVGVEQAFSVSVKGVEGLSRVLVVVASGTERKQQSVDVRVELSRLRRQQLDLD